MYYVKCPFKFEEKNKAKDEKCEVKIKKTSDEIDTVIKLREELRLLLTKVNELEENSKLKLKMTNNEQFVSGETDMLYKTKELYIRCFLKIRDAYYSLNDIQDNLNQLYNKGE